MNKDFEHSPQIEEPRLNLIGCAAGMIVGVIGVKYALENQFEGTEGTLGTAAVIGGHALAGGLYGKYMRDRREARENED